MAQRTAHEPELSEGEAVAEFQKAVKDHPDAQSHFNLGSAYYVAHDLEHALPELEETVRLAPDNYHAFYYLGVIYKVRGNKDKARQAFDKILKGGAQTMLKNQATIQLKSLDNSSGDAKLGR